MRDFAQQLSPRWTGFVSEKRFSEGIFRKSDFAIQRVTKPLLYQLSYVGAGEKIALGELSGKRQGGFAVAPYQLNDYGSTNVSPISRSAMRLG
jgi:hypothetical protein